jgi:hypothetical protein
MVYPFNMHTYQKLQRNSDETDNEALLPQHVDAPSRTTVPDWLDPLGRPVLTVVLICLAFFAGTLVHLPAVFDKDAICAAHTVLYRPPILSSGVNIKYTEKLYDGNFLQANIYRQDASPEVDDAWQALGTDYRPMHLTAEEGFAAGLTSNNVKVRDEYGGGFVANMEGLHHLHCLNLLRQTSKWNFDYYKALGEGAFKNDDRIVKLHSTHCLDILRQQLMCRADVGVFGQVWTHPEDPKPFVDFNTAHQCVNYDALRQWAEAKQVPVEVPPDLLAQPTPGMHIYPGTP